MIYPQESKYIEDAKDFNIIPVFREVRSDFETSLAFLIIANQKF